MARWAWRGLVARSRQRWLRIVLALVLALALLWAVIVAAPPWFVDDSSLEGRKIQNDVRGTLLQGLAGIAIAGGLYLTYQELHTSREGQITDRYTRAIDQLGSEQLDVRLGGIYALERVARDSPADRWTIEEVLAAFVRSHSPWPPSLPGQLKADALDVPDMRQRAPDVAACLKVLGRAGTRPHERHTTLDLGGADLRNVDLMGANLDGAMLTNSCLDGARLIDASLQGAFLSGARVDAIIAGTNMEGADFEGADLSGAILLKVRLNGARAAQNTRWPPSFDWRAAGVHRRD